MKKETKVSLLGLCADTLYLLSSVIAFPASYIEKLGLHCQRKAHVLKWGDDPWKSLD